MRFLVVEDDLTTNDVITEYLKECGHEVIGAYDGNEAIELFDDKIEFAILDIMLPGKDGVSVLKEIRKRSNIPVIMLTAISDIGTQANCFDGLADDYMTKPFSVILLGKRISAIMRRIGKPDNIWSYDKIVVDFTGFCAERDGMPVDIAPKEIMLFKYLLDHKGMVLTRDQILDHIWGEDIPISDRTIDTYIGRIRKKLGLDCITTVKGVGYKFEVRR